MSRKRRGFLVMVSGLLMLLAVVLIIIQMWVWAIFGFSHEIGRAWGVTNALIGLVGFSLFLGLLEY